MTEKSRPSRRLALRRLYNAALHEICLVRKDTMSAQLLMGNEAIALAALHPGINLACGHRHSTEIIETIARYNPAYVCGMVGQ